MIFYTALNLPKSEINISVIAVLYQFVHTRSNREFGGPCKYLHYKCASLVCGKKKGYHFNAFLHIGF